MSYDRFVDERLLTSRDALNNADQNESSSIDENARDFSQRFGHKCQKDLLIVTMILEEVEEKTRRGD